MTTEKYKRKSGRRDLPAAELRTHCVSVRMNVAELADLDRSRGRHQRGEALRLSSMSKLPAPVPSVNSQLRADLGRSLGNLATIAVTMRAGEYIEIEQIKTAVADLRAHLIGDQK